MSLYTTSCARGKSRFQTLPTLLLYIDVNAMLLHFISLHIHVSVFFATSHPSLPLPVQSLFLLCGIQAGGEWVWHWEQQQLLWQPYSKLVPCYSFLPIWFSPAHLSCVPTIQNGWFCFVKVCHLKWIHNHIFVNKENGWRNFTASLCLYWIVCKS